MKKQIFILVLALFASTSIFGQLAPRSFVCLPFDALHPIAGTAYNYTVDVPNPTGNKKYQWLVTQDMNFIVNKVLTTTFETPGTTSKFLEDAGATYNILTPVIGAAAASNTISLTWKSFSYVASAPVFVVVNVVNDDGTCSPNNLKVYRIEPINGFTLDIDNRKVDNTSLGIAGYGANMDRCITKIASATYSVAENGIIYDFGQDSLYYVVAAANWSGAWKPSVKISGLETGENIKSVKWSSDPAAAFIDWNPLVDDLTSTNTYVASGFVEPATAGTTVGAAGEVIYIKLVLDHSNMTTASFEGIVNEEVSLAVDGELFEWVVPPLPALPGYVTTNKHDVHNGNSIIATVCTIPAPDGFINDVAIQTILQRPKVDAAAAMPLPGLLTVKP